MIKERKSITLAEAKEILKEIKTDKAQALVTFIKKFTKLNAQDVVKLREQLLGLGLVKLKEENIIKLIDFMPKDAADVRKIFAGSNVSLDQNEIEKILSVFKK